MHLETGAVANALRRMEDRGLVKVAPASQRALRYEHRFDATYGVTARQRAVLCALLLRGPQTLAELHTRSERLAEFSGDRRRARHARSADPARARRLSCAYRTGRASARIATCICSPGPIDIAAPAFASPAARRAGAREATSKSGSIGSKAKSPHSRTRSTRCARASKAAAPVRSGRAPPGCVRPARVDSAGVARSLPEDQPQAATEIGTLDGAAYRIDVPAALESRSRRVLPRLRGHAGDVRARRAHLADVRRHARARFRGDPVRVLGDRLGGRGRRRRHRATAQAFRRQTRPAEGDVRQRHVDGRNADRDGDRNRNPTSTTARCRCAARSSRATA